MKIKSLFLLLFIGFQTFGFSQDYTSNQLKTIAEIWGQCYLFHPSVVRSDQKVNWEKQLVDFLPKLKPNLTNDEFISLINSDLLSKLNDPLTCVQKSISGSTNISKNELFQKGLTYDYYPISEEMLMSISGWVEFDSIISDKSSQKPLVLDLRIKSGLDLSPHEKSYFEFVASLLIDSPIRLGSSVSREHFGWDEYNDWWFYEQRWKIKNIGSLNPLQMDAQMLQYQYPEIDLSTIKTISRPIYFIVNKSLLSYYYPLLKALKLQRPQTYIAFQDSGSVFAPWYSNTIKYDFRDFEFILNPTLTINNNSVDLIFDYSSANIKMNDIEIFTKTNSSKHKVEKTNFNFDIIQKRYESSNESLSNEERILGIVKTWTIVKYFYVHHKLASANWENMLEPYLLKAQACTNDKEYYELIRNMMSKLNDSHVSTFHPSIVDFSELFVAPVQFEWIENKVIATAIMPEFIGEFDIKAGDEILSIDNKTIQQIITEQKIIVSASNEQSFNNTVFQPGNFVGAQDSSMILTLKRNNNEFKISIPRSIEIFRFFGFDDNRPAYEIKENNIGYLNLSALNNSMELETQLRDMQNTNGLIIDLRNGYPTDDYTHFIEMLTNKPIKGRIDITPIVFATKNSSITEETTQNEYKPDASFNYTKPIAVLIDKTMVSRPEDIAIELKQIENVFFVGEQTQGTDGEMTKISLPGGGETSFTGQCIKFADGGQFQGIGILPDYNIIKTIEGVKKGKDEILEEAIKLINKKTH